MSPLSRVPGAALVRGKESDRDITMPSLSIFLTFRVFLFHVLIKSDRFTKRIVSNSNYH